MTLLLVFSFSGCTWVSHKTYDRIEDECKTHAYIDNRLPEFITQRYGRKSQARLGIIPLSVPANFAGQGPGRPDWGYDFAVMLDQELLATSEIPVVEVLDRRDWPGKAEEFSAGNFGAIQIARDAGYDLVLVGMLQPLKTNNELSISTKVIETESGITVWYGTTNIISYQEDIHRSAAYINLTTLSPDKVYTPQMASSMAKCLAKKIVLQEEEVKERSCILPVCWIIDLFK